MAAVTQAGPFKIVAIAIGENLADQSAANVNVETDRRCGVVDVLRPALDDMRRYPIDKAAQVAGPRRLITRRQSGAQRNPPPDRLKFVAFIKPCRAIARERSRSVRIERPVFVCVVEYAAAVVVDEGFRQRTFGDDHIVSFKLDVNVLDLADALGLHDRRAVDQILCFDQHTVVIVVRKIHCVVGRDPKIAPRHVVIERTGLDADRKNIFPPHDEAAGIAPAPDPFDRPRRAGSGHNFVADLKLLDPPVAAWGANECACAIAGDVRHRNVIAGAGVIADLEPGVVGFERCALRKAGERAANRTARLVVDDGEGVADAWRKAVDQRNIECCAA